MPRHRKPQQLPLALPSGRGGARKGAGRKPKGLRPEVPHLRRAPVESRYPVHLTVKLVRTKRSLRVERVLWALHQVLRELHEARADFRVIAFSLQHDHLHLVAEGDGPASFSSGVRSLMIRLGKRLNQALRRSGRLFSDRHHRRLLTTPREVRNALAYVLCNRRRHLAKLGHKLGRGVVDGFSSGRWFSGWRQAVEATAKAAPVVGARTWLGRVGWRRHGLLSLSEVPGVARSGRRRPT